MKRLLLVDDEQNVLVGMGRKFRAAGFHVDTAAEREEAEALLASETYDGVIVDLSLTGGYGPEGFKVIVCARENCPRARVLVLTASGSAETRSEAFRLGADAFLQKPQPLDEIRRVLDGAAREMSSTS
jgi:two-component system OmpR family response regulator